MKSAKWSEIVLVRRLLVFMEYIVVGMKPDSKTYMSTIFIYDKSHLPHGVLRQTAMYSPDRGSDKPIGIDEWWPYNKTEWSVGWSTKKFWFAIHKSLEFRAHIEAMIRHLEFEFCVGFCITRVVRDVEPMILKWFCEPPFSGSEKPPFCNLWTRVDGLELIAFLDGNSVYDAWFLDKLRASRRRALSGTWWARLRRRIEHCIII